MTECSEHELRLEGPGRRSLVAGFDGGRISSDGGVLLLQAAEQRTRIVERFARCFTDHRDAARVKHSVALLARQRVFGPLQRFPLVLQRCIKTLRASRA